MDRVLPNSSADAGLDREGSRSGAEEFAKIKYMLMSGLDGLGSVQDCAQSSLE